MVVSALSNSRLILLDLLSWSLLAYNAGMSNKLDVNLYSLAGILHLFIGLVDRDATASDLV